MARALIIGYGNSLRTDDGFGWHAAQKLATCLCNSDAEVLAQHQLTPEMAETASHFQLVIFIDAAADLPPGELRCERIARGGNGAQADASSFSHFLTPASLLALTAKLYAKFPDSYYISVGAESFAEGESISPIVQAAFEPLLVQVCALLAQGKR
jgi:hydrogenase maturation protease